MANDFEKMPVEELGEVKVTLDLDDGARVECVIVAIYPAGDRQYVALLPVDPAEGEEDEVYLYRYTETEDGEDDIANIESDEEYEIASDAFDELLDTWEFEEEADEEE